ncbi:acyl-CoA N-acyltransferase [Ochromonadaceae sp. CCMP2298]|nr:acyl-CoA N-acyltransferase [Ochromonadaceae sp. CCMP2298]
MFDNEPEKVELTVFSDTDSEYAQGMQLMNDVIVEGKSWPYLDQYETMEAYKGYFHSHSAFLVRFTDPKHGADILGCFYIKPNFPGRCSHVCNGGFITNPKYRGLGVGSLMGSSFKRLAKDLGYRSSLFNLVFASNKASVRLWTKLGFTQLAVIPKVAVLEGEKGYVDAYQMHCDFYPEES